MSDLFDRRDEWANVESPFASLCSGRPAQPPNVIVIMADDLGSADLGCYGSLHTKTPHLDALAASGLRFTDGYAAAPTCSPTRVAFYTGRHAQRLRVGMEEPLVTRSEEFGIPHDHPALPGLLRDRGYSTAMFGKWHCGWLPWYSPLRIGFDVFFGNFGGALDYFSHVAPSGMHDLWEGEVEVEETGYYTHKITERARDYIGRRESGSPFYLQLNYTAPHWPWEGPNDEAWSERVTAAIRSGGPGAMFDYEGGTLAKYAELVETLDEAVGELVTELEMRGLREDTLIVFMSDNGGERFSFNWPFVGGKGDLEEGGIRIPFIMSWPGVIPASAVSDLPVSTLDVTATLLDLARTSIDPAYALDGTSLLPWLIEGAPEPRHDLLWRTEDQGAMRRGRFKLLVNRYNKPMVPHLPSPPSNQIRLIDVTSDGREVRNEAAEYPEDLAVMLQEWQTFDESLLPYDRSSKPVMPTPSGAKHD